MEKDFFHQKNILMFDGECNFCNSSVNFVVDNNKKKDIIFCSLQSKTGQDILKHFLLPTENFNTLIFIENGKYYIKSKAVFRLSNYLDGYIKYISIFNVVPALITNFFYDLIAKNRYRLMGKANACRIPTKELKERFLT